MVTSTCILLSLFAVIRADDPRCKAVPEPHDVVAVGQRWQYSEGCKTCSGKECIGCYNSTVYCARCVYDEKTCKQHMANDCHGIIEGAKLRGDKPCKGTSLPFLPPFDKSKNPDPGFHCALKPGGDIHNLTGKMSYSMAKNRCANYRNAAGLVSGTGFCIAFTWNYNETLDPHAKDGQTYFVNGKSEATGGIYFCYKVKVGEYIYQFDSPQKSATNCEEAWKTPKNKRFLGQYEGDVGHFKESYTGGDSDGCPEGRARQATLVVETDPLVEENSMGISVAEPRGKKCRYQVALKVPPLMTFKNGWHPVDPTCGLHHQEKLQAPPTPASNVRSSRSQFTPYSHHMLVTDQTHAPKYPQTNLDTIFNAGQCSKENNCAGFTFCNPGVDPPVTKINVYFAAENKPKPKPQCFSYTLWPETAAAPLADSDMETVDVVV